MSDAFDSRKKQSRDLIEEAKPHLDCLHDRGVDVTVWGSAARDMSSGDKT